MLPSFVEFFVRALAATRLSSLLRAWGVSSAMLVFSSPLAVAQTPTLVQHVASSANPIGVGISLNAFKFTLPNSVGTGNCLVLGISYPHGNTPTVTDNNGNAWPSSPAVSADAGVGNYVSAIFVLPNAKAGLTTITVTFGAAIIPFEYTVSEFNNVATVTPVNGSQATASVSGSATHATGSFTPTDNDANGGNLIWNYYAISGAAAGNPTSWVAGGSFTLLDGDIAWTSGQGFPHASQWYVQTTAAAINPSITATGDTQGYNCVAVALKAANAGTAVPAGIHVAKIIHQTSGSIPATLHLQEPVTGNLRVLEISLSVITGISDSEGGTWTKVTDSGGAAIWYSANRSANPNLIVTLATTGAQPQSIRFYDISGAAAAPFDVSATTAGVVISGLTTLSNQPVITPTTANGLIIAAMALGQGPGLGFSAGTPAGAIWDLVNSTGQTDMDLMDNADCLGHYYNPNTSAVDWNWHFTAIGANSSGGSVAVAFKAAVALKSVAATHDFNGDHKSDIAWRDTTTDSTSGVLAIWEMSGMQVLNPTATTVGNVPYPQWTIIGISDFNGDGYADILWRDTNNDLAIWEMNGTQILNPTATFVAIVPGWSVVGTGDFNGDGKSDILWTDGNGNYAIWEMNGTQILNPTATFVAFVSTNWSVVGTGDFNGDGKSDILWKDGTGDYAIWEMNGTQILNPSASFVATVSAPWSVIRVGDFNGDGMSDLLWTDGNGNYAIWEMNGTQILNPTATFVAFVSTNWSVVGTGDYNGDGMSDMLWTNGNGNYAIWEMQGTQILNPSTTFVANVSTNRAVQLPFGE
jgi:FG-GAP-like repeat